MQNRENVIFDGSTSSVIVVRVKRTPQDHLGLRIVPGSSARDGVDPVLNQVQGTVVAVGAVIPIVAHVEQPVRAGSQGGHVVNLVDVINGGE